MPLILPPPPTSTHAPYHPELDSLVQKYGRHGVLISTGSPPMAAREILHHVTEEEL